MKSENNLDDETRNQYHHTPITSSIDIPFNFEQLPAVVCVCVPPRCENHIIVKRMNHTIDCTINHRCHSSFSPGRDEPVKSSFSTPYSQRFYQI